MKKVLFVATVTKHINAFHIPYLKWFKENGYEVHVASNGEETIEYCDKHFNLNFARFPIKLQNIKVYQELKSIIEENKYEIVHSHTPVGGVLARLAVKCAKRKYKIRNIYTAHGFHFYKGASMLNWLIFYPIEKILSKYTDDLITINKEDYEIAKKKFKAKNIYYVPGVGVNLDKFNKKLSNEQKEELCNQIGISQENYIILYVAELSKRKNQMMLIQAVREVIKENNKIKLILVGSGPEEEKYKKVIEKENLQENIKLLGYRKDVPNLMQITDLYISTSTQEGLPVNIMEAMAVPLPIIATDCRGNRDLIENGTKGYIVKIGDIIALKEKIMQLNTNPKEAEKFRERVLIDCQKFKIDNIVKVMEEIYLRKEEDSNVNL